MSEFLVEVDADGDVGRLRGGEQEVDLATLSRAVSLANAVGVMQVIPSSGEWASDLVGRRLDLLDPQDNVTAGVAIIRQLHRMTSNGDNAIAGYYQGLGSVNRNGMYRDTRNYVANVRSLMNQYR